MLIWGDHAPQLRQPPHAIDLPRSLRPMRMTLVLMGAGVLGVLLVVLLPRLLLALARDPARTAEDR